MSETADIAVIDGEDAGSTPWEFASIFEGAGNSFTKDAGAAAHGDFGYKLLFGGANALTYGATAISRTEIYGRGYVYISSGYAFGTSYDLSRIFLLRDASDNLLLSIAIKNAGSPGAAEIWRIDGVDVGYVNESDHFSTGEWHYIDFHWRAGSGSDGGAQVWIDGDSVLNKMDVDLSAYTATKFDVGPSYSCQKPINGDYLYIDDVLLSTTGPIGEYLEVGGYGGNAATIRQSAMQILRPYEISLPPPDGTISQEDRQSIVWTYAGILAPIARLATGILLATFVGKIAEAAFAGKLSEIAFAGKLSEASFTGKLSEAAFTGKTGDASFTGG